MAKGYLSVTGLPLKPPSWKGKKFSEDHRKKLGLAQIGNKKGLNKKRSEEWREMMKKIHSGNQWGKGNIWDLERRKKYSEARKGAGNPSWQGGITKIKYAQRMSITHGIEYKEWRRKVFERDHFTCIMCGDNRGGNLEADHIKPFAQYPELRLDINNGRTLCHECHKKTPTYGKHNISS